MSPKAPSALKDCTNDTETDDKGITHYRDPITFEPIEPEKVFKLPVGHTVQCYDIDTIYDYFINKGNMTDISRNSIPSKTIFAIILRYFEVHRFKPDYIERWFNEPLIESILKSFGVLKHMNLYCMYHGIIENTLPIHDKDVDSPIVLQDEQQVCLYNPKTYKDHNVVEWIYMSMRSPDIVGLKTPSVESVRRLKPATYRDTIRLIARLNHLDISSPREKAIQDHLDAYYKIPVEGLVVAYNYSYAKYYKINPPVSVLVYNTHYKPKGFDYPAFDYWIDFKESSQTTVALDAPYAYINYLGAIGNLQPHNPDEAVFKDIHACGDGILNALSYSFNRLRAEDAALVLKNIRENYHVKQDLKLLDSPKRSSSSRLSSGGRRSKFDAMTVKDLQGLCKARGIAYSGLRKAELILKLQRKK